MREPPRRHTQVKTHPLILQHCPDVGEGLPQHQLDLKGLEPCSEEVQGTHRPWNTIGPSHPMGEKNRSQDPGTGGLHRKPAFRTPEPVSDELHRKPAFRTPEPVTSGLHPKPASRTSETVTGGLHLRPASRESEPRACVPAVMV